MILNKNTWYSNSSVHDKRINSFQPSWAPLGKIVSATQKISISKLWIAFLSVSASFSPMFLIPSPPKLRSRLHSTHLWSLKPAGQVTGGEIQSVTPSCIKTSQKKSVQRNILFYFVRSCICYILLENAKTFWILLVSFWLQGNWWKYEIVTIDPEHTMHKIAAGSCIWIFQVHSWRKILYKPVLLIHLPSHIPLCRLMELEET